MISQHHPNPSHAPDHFLTAVCVLTIYMLESGMQPDSSGLGDGLPQTEIKRGRAPPRFAPEPCATPAFEALGPRFRSNVETPSCIVLRTPDSVKQRLVGRLGGCGETSRPPGLRSLCHENQRHAAAGKRLRSSPPGSRLPQQECYRRQHYRNQAYTSCLHSYCPTDSAASPHLSKALPREQCMLLGVRTAGQ